MDYFAFLFMLHNVSLQTGLVQRSESKNSEERFQSPIVGVALLSKFTLNLEIMFRLTFSRRCQRNACSTCNTCSTKSYLICWHYLSVTSLLLPLPKGSLGAHHWSELHCDPPPVNWSRIPWAWKYIGNLLTNISSGLVDFLGKHF